MKKSNLKGAKNIGLSAAAVGFAPFTGGVSLAALPAVMAGTDALIGDDAPEERSILNIGRGNPEAGYSSMEMPKDYGVATDIVEAEPGALETVGQLTGAAASMFGGDISGALSKGAIDGGLNVPSTINTPDEVSTSLMDAFKRNKYNAMTTKGLNNLSLMHSPMKYSPIKTY